MCIYIYIYSTIATSVSDKLPIKKGGCKFTSLKFLVSYMKLKIWQQAVCCE